MAGAPLELQLTQLAGGDAPTLQPELWGALDRRASKHRLQPLLHRLHGNSGAIPETIRAGWSAAYRTSAITALHQRRELLQLASLFAGEGLRFVALKGAWLAWNAWPDPALRPLRDLDLYLPGDAALKARDLLLAQGWQQDLDDGFAQLGPAGWLARFKALPALTSPAGVVVDLHARLWDDGKVSPPAADALFERALADPEHPHLLYPGAVDQLMHLSIHASFHRFDGGPLMLADFGHLLLRHEFVWPEVWNRAGDEGWLPSLSLCLEGARRWSGIDAPWPKPPRDAPRNLVEALPLLLAKPLDAREGDIAAAKLASGGIAWSEKLRRIAARRERHSGVRPYLGWLAGETIALARSSLGSRDRIAAMTALDDWLAG